MEIEEDGEEADPDGSEEDDGDGEGEDAWAKEFTQKWGWIDAAVRVKEIMGITLDDVFAVNIIYFLNILSYSRDKGEFEKRQMDNYKKKLNNDGRRTY